MNKMIDRKISIWILTVPGVPIPKARPRFSRGKVYNVQEKEAEAFAWQVMKQWHHPPVKGPMALVLEFVMPIPKSTNKKNRRWMLEGMVPHVKKPDLDNLEKFALDCLEGLLYENDSQVYWLKSIKRYGRNPRTVIMERGS